MKSQEYHRHCDVYAFGISLLQMLTGRSAVSWLDAGRSVHITDFCDVDEEDAMSIADLQAGWPQEVAQTLLTLGKQNTLGARPLTLIDFAGLECTRSGSLRIAKNRPKMDTVIARIAAMVELPPLPLPAPQAKECMVIIVAP
jgi:hypothetical protein